MFYLLRMNIKCERSGRNRFHKGICSYEFSNSVTSPGGGVWEGASFEVRPLFPSTNSLSLSKTHRVDHYLSWIQAYIPRTWVI